MGDEESKHARLSFDKGSIALIAYSSHLNWYPLVVF
jgi:hypothetical protein